LGNNRERCRQHGNNMIDYLYELEDLDQYDGAEISIVVDYMGIDGLRCCEALATTNMSEVDLSQFNEPIVFYSVYAHRKQGGVVCVADFEDEQKANILYDALAKILATGI